MSTCIYSPSEKIWGGGQIYIEYLCNYLNSRGVVSFVATSEPTTFSCPVREIPSVASKVDRLALVPSLVRELKKEGVSTVVLNDLSSLWLAPLFKMYGIKVVSLLHLYLQRRNAAGLGHSYIEYHLLRLASRFCNRIFSVNKNNQRSFPVRVDFVGNFISSWFFNDERTLEKKYDLGLISRLSIEKNIPLFVQLVKQLNDSVDRPIKALIVGKGAEESNIRLEVERLGLRDNITFLPWADRAELPRIYDQIKCFAITSHHEGFATTVLEAHARGVPVISTRSAGFCGDFVEGFGGKTGLVFTQKESESTQFTENLKLLIETSSDYHNLCVAKAALFSEERVLGEILAGIKSLLTTMPSKV